MMEHRCEGRVRSDRYYYHRCEREGTIAHAGHWYCGTHDPVARKAKQEARDAAYTAKWDAIQKAQDAAKAEQARQTAQLALLPKLVAQCRQITRQLTDDGVLFYGESTVDEMIRILAQLDALATDAKQGA